MKSLLFYFCSVKISFKQKKKERVMLSWSLKKNKKTSCSTRCKRKKSWSPLFALFAAVFCLFQRQKLFVKNKTKEKSFVFFVGKEVFFCFNSMFFFLFSLFMPGQTRLQRRLTFQRVSSLFGLQSVPRSQILHLYTIHICKCKFRT